MTDFTKWFPILVSSLALCASMTACSVQEINVSDANIRAYMAAYLADCRAMIRSGYSWEKGNYDDKRRLGGSPQI